MTFRYDETQKGNLLNMKLTLIQFDEEMFSQELLEDQANMQHVFLEILGKDKNIIQVYKYKSVQHVS